MYERNRELKADTNEVLADNVLSCSRCSYKWVPRNQEKTPRSCPSCRSMVWMKKYGIKDCRRCGHQWSSADENPKRCPSCGTYKWDDVPTSYNCSKCRYRWNSKRDWPPKRCPRCRSTTWMVNQVAYEPKKIEDENDTKRNYALTVSKQRIDYVVRSYNEGRTCTNISLTSGIPFSIVYDIVMDNCSNDRPRI